MTKVVTIGGGTGTFTVLSSLRDKPDIELTALVTTADDGGSAGRLRDAYGFLPAGDVRQALVALSEDGTMLRELFAYRFSKGDVAGHNLGNLFLTALTDLLGSDMKAVEAASSILRIEGRVIPVSERPAVLCAKLADGTTIASEHLIDESDRKRPRIVELSYAGPVPLSQAAKEAILGADFIVIGPGDLYASTIAALLPEGMREALTTSDAKLIYIANLFTKAGQTRGYPASEHVSEVVRYAGKHPDVIFVHDGSFPDDVLAAYAEEDEYPVANDLVGNDGQVRMLPLASVQASRKEASDALKRSLIRHDREKLGEALMTYIHE